MPNTRSKTPGAKKVTFVANAASNNGTKRKASDTQANSGPNKKLPSQIPESQILVSQIPVSHKQISKKRVSKKEKQVSKKQVLQKQISKKQKSKRLTNATRNRTKTSSPSSDEDDLLIDDDDEAIDSDLNDSVSASDRADIEALTSYLQRLEASPDDKSSKQKINEIKAALKILINKINEPKTKMMMNKKIGKLKEDLQEKNDFLTIIFGSTKAIKNPKKLQQLQKQLQQLKANIISHTEKLDSDSGDNDIWYDECLQLQETVCANLKDEYVEAYRHFTTPLYLFLKRERHEQNSELNNLLKEFYEFIESDDSMFTTNRAYATRHIVISDLVWVVFMNTGLWRQLFKDGHKTLRQFGIKGDINSIAQTNAQTKHIVSETVPPGSNIIIPCPCCSRPILKSENGKIKKITAADGGTPSAADHTNPITHAFSEYKMNAQKINLVMICQSCNSAKLNAHFIKFFTFLKNNKTTPLYNLVKIKDIRNATFTAQFGEERLQFYIDIMHDIINAGVLPITSKKTMEPSMVTQALQIKTVYTNALKTVTDQLEKNVRELLAAARMVGLAEPETDTKSYDQWISTLFGIIIGARKTKTRTNEEVLGELFDEITTTQPELTLTNLQDYFADQSDPTKAIIFNSIPNIRSESYAAFSQGLASYLFNEIKKQSTSSDKINKEEFKTYFVKFIEKEIEKIKNKDSAGKTKNLSKKKHKSKMQKSFLNKTLKGKGKMFK
jgi:hypothetical protein